MKYTLTIEGTESGAKTLFDSISDIVEDNYGYGDYDDVSQLTLRNGAKATLKTWERPDREFLVHSTVRVEAKDADTAEKLVLKPIEDAKLSVEEIYADQY